MYLFDFLIILRYNQNYIPIQSQQDIGNANSRILRVPKSNYLLVPLFNYLTSSYLIRLLTINTNGKHKLHVLIFYYREMICIIIYHLFNGKLFSQFFVTIKWQEEITINWNLQLRDQLIFHNLGNVLDDNLQKFELLFDRSYKMFLIMVTFGM